MDATWANGIVLKGYEAYVSRDVLACAGRYRLGLYLYWQPTEPLNRKLKVFMHVVGGDDQLAAQHDGLPALWTYNTDEWQVGETIVDFHQLILDESSAIDVYTVQVGWHTEEEGRVPIAGPADRGDSLPLHTFVISDEN